MHLPQDRGPIMAAGYSFADPHAHVLKGFYGTDISKIFQRARDVGAVRIINVGIDVPTSREAFELARTNPGLLSTAGVHPHDASSYDEAAEEEIARLYGAGAAAIGETGLDFHYDYSPREAQMRAFRGQVGLAARLGAPVIVHSREAWPETMEILQEFSDRARLLMHCFSGGVEDARKCLDLGCMISVSGVLTFPGSDEIREVLKFVPRDMLMLETDCPFLAPVPKRGKRNEPAFLPFAIDAAAEVLGTDPFGLSETLLRNMESFFGFTGI